MRQRSDCNWRSDDDLASSPSRVLDHLAIFRPTEHYNIWPIELIVLDHDCPSQLDGAVCAAAEDNADARSRQRGSVIDAVTHCRHLFTLGLQCRHFRMAVFEEIFRGSLGQIGRRGYRQEQNVACAQEN
jgi:hypothetical protein